MKKQSKSFKIICSLLIILFSNLTLFPGYAEVQAPRGYSLRLRSGQAGFPSGTALNLPSPNQFVPLSKTYSYPVLKGVKINPQDPFKLEFIIDAENKEGIDKEELSYLIKYFLAALTLPEEELWVNLSPYEKNRIIPQDLGLTDLGKDMLKQDYILKQLVSSITHPESKLGKKYWSKIHEEISKLTGNSKVPIDTFNKVWIVPESAQVYENGNVALITEAKLKAMMEGDFQAAGRKLQASGSPTNNQQLTTNYINKTTSKVMRQTILPEIEKDINYGENFAKLRQMYYSLILAVWFKKKLKDSIFQYYINQGKIQGIDLEDKDVKENIYNLYTESFKKGLYDYIKTEKTTKGSPERLVVSGVESSRRIKRRYYSGGIKFNTVSSGIKIANLPVISAIKKMFSYAKINLSIFKTKKIDFRVDEDVLEKMRHLSHISQLEQEPFKFIKDSIDFLRDNLEIPSDIELIIGGGVVRDLLLGLSINNPDPIMAIKDLDIMFRSPTRTFKEIIELIGNLSDQAQKKGISQYDRTIEYTSNGQTIIIDIPRLSIDKNNGFLRITGPFEKISVNTLGISIKGNNVNFIYNEQALNDIKKGEIEILESDGEKLSNNTEISIYTIFKALILKHQLGFEFKETSQKIIEEYKYSSILNKNIPRYSCKLIEKLTERLTYFTNRFKKNKKWQVTYNYFIEGLNGLILSLYKKSQSPKLVTEDLKYLLKLSNDNPLYVALLKIERCAISYKSKNEQKKVSNLEKKQLSIQINLPKIRNYKNIDEEWLARAKVSFKGKKFRIMDHLSTKTKNRTLKVLSAGCGRGVQLNEAALLYGNNINPYGVDVIDWNKIDLNERERFDFKQMHGKNKWHLLKPKFQFIKGDLKTVKLPKPMDFISSFFVFQYIDDPLKAWCNLFNQLAPGGIFVSQLHIPNDKTEIIEFYTRIIKEMQSKGIDIETYSLEKPSIKEFHLFFIAQRKKEEKVKFNTEVDSIKDIDMPNASGQVGYTMKIASYKEINGKQMVSIIDNNETTNYSNQDASSAISTNKYTQGGINWGSNDINLKTAGSSLQFNLPLETIQEFQASSGITFEIVEIKQEIGLDEILKVGGKR